MKHIFFTAIILLIINQNLFSQSRVITGLVTDSKNEPIIGATIKAEGTTLGTITDIDGKFRIEVPSVNINLVVSYVGMKPQRIDLRNKSGQITVVLQDDEKILDELVVVGYGTQRKINATGAVKTIDAKAIESRPISNAVQGLQGVIPGLNITNDNGGAPGQEMNINIRGLGTIGEGSSGAPLVLIDGIEGSLSAVNPNDIESISVLKDGASASIYGSRAPFGVILITTKSGEEGKIRISYSGNLRLTNPVNVPKPVDSYSYALAMNDSYFNSGGNPPYNATWLDRILKFQRGEYTSGYEKYGLRTEKIIKDGVVTGLTWGWDTFANTNWYDVHIKDIAPAQEHNFSISGGGKTASYFLSTNYLDQSGIFTYADEKYNRFTVNGKLDVKLTENLKLQWSSRFIDIVNNRPTSMTGLGNLFYHNLGRRNPLSPLVMPTGEYSGESMIQALQNGGKHIDKNQTFYNQLQLTYEPLKNWRVYADIGSRIENPRSSKQFKKIWITQPDGKIQYLPVYEGIENRNDINVDGTFRRWPGAGETFYERAFGHVNYFSTSFRTDYEFKVNKHNLKFLIGSQSEYYYTETVRVASDDILIDDKPFLPVGSGTNPRMSEKKGEWSNLGFFSRINYNYADRYMLEMNLRADGASRFPADKRWAVFPAFSVGWNVAEEAFFEPVKTKGIEMMKLRASYSKLGNQNTNSFYPYYQYMNINTSTLLIDGKEAIILKAPQPFSTDITWEKIENIGAGIDLILLKNRFTVTFDVYQRTTMDMVGPAKPIPNIFGATVPRTNNAELRTRGWELELGWRDKIGKDFNYTISASVSDFNNIVTKYESTEKRINGYYVGKDIGDIWGYSVIGIAKSDKEMLEHLKNHSQSSLGQNWGGGDFMYRNLDNDPAINSGSMTVDNPGDLRVIGNSTPRFAFGFNLGFQYKSFDFKTFIQGIGKRDLSFLNLNGSIHAAPFLGVASEWQRSIYKEHLDYFRFVGDPLGANMDAYYPRIRFDANNHYAADYYIQNGAYARVKNIQFGYTFPKNDFFKKIFTHARIYVSGENVFTLTKLRIFDPEAALGAADSEMGSGKTYPINRVFAAGLEINF